jgi:hypothetical protein
MSTKILIIGACTNRNRAYAKLRSIYGTENVIASDIRKLNTDVVNSGPFEVVNALDFNQIEHLVEVQITDVYLMAALLSATAEKNQLCLGLKYELLVSCFEFGESRKNKNILAFEYCRFGPTTPKENTPQYGYGAFNGLRNQ